MQRRTTRNAVMAVLTLAVGLAVAASLGSTADAAVVNQALSCGIGGNQTMSINGVAPATAAPGATFSVDLTPQPAKAAGGNIKNLVWNFQAPTGATLVAGSASTLGNGSTTGGSMGTSSAAISGTVVQLKVPGEISNGATFTPPTLRFQLLVTGGAGTTLAMKPRTSGAAYTLTAVGTLSISCTTSGSVASFTSTSVVAPTTTTTTAPTTTSTTGSTTTTTGGSTTTTTAPTTTTTTAPPVLTTQSWSPTGDCGSVQTTTAPANATSVAITAGGGKGGKGGGQAGGTGGSGSTGGQAVGTFTATPGQSFAAIIGCDGVDGGGFGNSATPAGYGAGGGTGRGSIIAGQTGASGGSGGGASAACLGTSCTGSAGGVSPLVVAGGGGGGGVSNCSGTGAGSGGAGGSGSTTSGSGGQGPSGANGTSGNGAGGAGGANSSATAADGGSAPNGSGGAGVNVVGGGGGGGLVGGTQGSNASTGCKGAGGGGGGSSWIEDGATGTAFGTATSPGVVLTFTISTPAPTTTSTTAPTTTMTAPPACIPDLVPFATSTELVTQQFDDFADRAPTSGELTTETTAIDTCTKTADAFIETMIPTDQTLTDARLVRIYHAYFKRAPDPSGFAYWTRQLEVNGRGIIVVAQKFAESSEFKTTYGSLNNDAFVELVYQNVLGRASEPTGKAFWVNRLNKGTANRGTVMSNFSESSENITLKRPIVSVWRAIRTMRQTFPGNTAFTTLTTPILAGTATVQDAIHTIRTSPTYADRF